jgi:hypothetical protein
MSLHPSFIRLAAGAAATLALGAAPPAVAASGPIYGGHTAQDAPIALRVGAGGRALKQLLVHIQTSCDDGRGLVWSGAASFAAFKPPTIETGENVFSPARLSRRGVFRATGQARDTYGDKLGTATQTIRGTLRRGVAHGTISATIDLVDPATGAKVTSCRSGTQRWAARSAPGRTFAGLTSNGRPIVVERSRDGRMIDSLWVSWLAPCQGGGAWAVGEELLRFPVSRTGRFGEPFSDDVKPPDGGTRAFAYRLRGLAGATRVSGTFRVEVTDKDTAGATTDSCDTTLLSWSARSTRGRAPRVSPKPGEVRRVGR